MPGALTARLQKMADGENNCVSAVTRRLITQALDREEGAARASASTPQPAQKRVGPMTEWLNIGRAAKYLGEGRSKQFVRREIHAGRLRAARIGGRGEFLTCPAWLDEYVLEQTKPIIVPTKRRA